MAVLVGVLTRGFVSVQWALAFRNLQLPDGSEIFVVAGLPYDHARNSVVRRMMKSHFEWLLFLDDDVIPPSDVFRRLSSHRREIVSGLYFTRMGKIQPTVFREAQPLPYAVDPCPPDKLLEVDLVPGGCLLIHRRVLEKMAPPWFEWLIHREDLPSGERVGEDCFFCRKAREAGFGIYADTSVACAHVGLGYSDTDGRFLPLGAPS